MGRCRGEISAPVAAGGKDRHVGAEAMDFAGRLVAHGLAVERVKDGMTGAIGGRTGALRGALAIIRGHTAERALINLALVGARERNAPMLQLVDRIGSVPAEIFDGILVTQPIRSLDGI